jgi:PAS domain S-box-containing protein
VPHFDARWQRSETLLAIFDQISDAVFFYDKTLHLVQVNKSGEQLFAMPAKGMIGKACWELFAFAAGEPHQGGVAEDAPPEAGQAWCLPTGIVRLRMDFGRERRVIIRTMELLDQDGALEAVVAIVTDITDRAAGAGPHPSEPHPRVEPVSSAERAPAHKYHPVVMRNRRVAAVCGAVLLMFVLVLIANKAAAPGRQLTPEQRRQAAADIEKREAVAKFNAMTPAQHMERARLALRAGATTDVIMDGLRHLKVIPPSAPEAARARALQKDLVKAGNLASAQTLIDAGSNSDVRDGMEKLQRANGILDAVTRQYPDDKGARQLSRAAQTAAEQLAVRYPQDFAAAEITLVDFKWEKGGFGTVMMANFTVRNNSPVDVADLKIRCEHYAESGVVLEENAATAFGIVKAQATTRIPNVNMGFLNAQAANTRNAKTNCEITSLKLASDSQAFGSSR